MGIIVMGLVWGGSMDKVGAFELVGGYEGVTGCIEEAKLNSILMSKLDCEGGVGGGTSGRGDACEMGTGISRPVTA